MDHTAALIITSAQNDLMSPGGKAWEMTKHTVEANEVVKKLSRLVEAARKANIPVIMSPVAFDYEVMVGFEPKSAIQRIIIDNALLEAETWGSQLIDELGVTEGDTVLPPRQGFSSFWAGPINDQLEGLGVTEIYLAGMLAEGCVESHARDAAENGYRPVVITDAIGSTSSDLLSATLQTLELHCQRMEETEKVIAGWVA